MTEELKIPQQHLSSEQEKEHVTISLERYNGFISSQRLISKMNKMPEYFKQEAFKFIIEMSLDFIYRYNLTSPSLLRTTAILANSVSDVLLLYIKELKNNGIEVELYNSVVSSNENRYLKIKSIKVANNIDWNAFEQWYTDNPLPSLADIGRQPFKS